MPIRPRPITYRCPKCQWSKTIQPRSDARMPGDRVDTCPRCGHTDRRLVAILRKRNDGKKRSPIYLNAVNSHSRPSNAWIQKNATFAYTS